LQKGHSEFNSSISPIPLQTLQLSSPAILIKDFVFVLTLAVWNFIHNPVKLILSL